MVGDKPLEVTGTYTPLPTFSLSFYLQLPLPGENLRLLRSIPNQEVEKKAKQRGRQ